MARVLLVDDEPSIRLTMAEFVRREGHEALVAGDFDAALALLDSNDIDIAVIDIIMPRRGGVELLREIHHRAPEMPVVMMTGEPNTLRLPEIVRARAHDFLIKPVTKRSLLVAVAGAVEKSRLDADKRKLEEAIRRYTAELERRVTAQTAELIESRDFLGAVLDSAIDYALVAMDTERRTTLFNRGAELIFGYTAAQMTGRPFGQLLEDGWQIDLLAPPGGAPPSVSECSPHGRARRADGSDFPASVVMTPITSRCGDRPLGYLAIIKDLTEECRRVAEMREMQARLAHNEKIAALGQAAAQVAHEVKNPLSGLRLYALHLRDRVQGKLPPDELLLIDRITSEVERLKVTTEQILDFARPLCLAPLPFDLVRVINDLLGLLEPHTAAGGVRVTPDLPAPALTLVADETSIRSALFNLMLNAVQAMTDEDEPGDAPVERERTLTVTACEESAHIHISIADTGRGMTDEQITRASQPFYTTKSEGLGLGMPYANKIVEQHRGSLTIESRVGEGTRVEIVLPAAG